MRATFIRHGTSQANMGLACPDFGLIELTPEGHIQAEALAAKWDAPPHLIVHSPFLRTIQTAAPTIARFADVPVEVWPVQEFCNLSPVRFNGTTYRERAPFVEAYWQRCDPDSNDGGTAESFADFLNRARASLARLAELPTQAHVFVYSHGFFMNAIRSLIRFPVLDDRERMRGFVSSFASEPIANTGQLFLVEKGGRWSYVESTGSNVAVDPSVTTLR